MAFQFPLATVLRVRLLREEREERLLQKIFQEIAHVQQSIASIDEQLVQVVVRRMTQVADVMMARDLQLSASTAAALYECKRELETQIDKLEQLKESQLFIYRSARRDRETLTDLRVKKLSAYTELLAASEQKRLDDNFNARRRRASTL